MDEQTSKNICVAVSQFWGSDSPEYIAVLALMSARRAEPSGEHVAWQWRNNVFWTWHFADDIHHAELMRQHGYETRALAVVEPPKYHDQEPATVTKALTVVFLDVTPDEAAEIIGHPKWSAGSWSHALNDRDRALIDAEKAREERNREHVRLNAEWMAKCEELRAKVIEECAQAAESEDLIYPPDNDGDTAYRCAVSHCASAIRNLAKKA